MPVATEQLVERIWERDPTVWTGSGEEKWLGWLDEPKRMEERIGELREFADGARTRFETFVLLGMGGSSLAPEVLKRTFGWSNGLIPRIEPAIATANSQRKNSAPSS